MLGALPDHSLPDTLASIVKASFNEKLDVSANLMFCTWLQYVLQVDLNFVWVAFESKSD